MTQQQSDRGPKWGKIKGSDCRCSVASQSTKHVQTNWPFPLPSRLKRNLLSTSALWLMTWFTDGIIYAIWQGINHGSVGIHGFSAAALPHSKPNYIYVMRCTSSAALKCWTRWKCATKCGPNEFEYIKNIQEVSQGVVWCRPARVVLC